MPSILNCKKKTECNQDSSLFITKKNGNYTRIREKNMSVVMGQYSHIVIFVEIIFKHFFCDDLSHFRC